MRRLRATFHLKDAIILNLGQDPKLRRQGTVYAVAEGKCRVNRICTTSQTLSMFQFVMTPTPFNATRTERKECGSEKNLVVDSQYFLRRGENKP